MSYGRQYEQRSEQDGSQKEPLAESVSSRFGREINVGDPVVTFTQSGRSTRVGEGIFKGVMRVRDYDRGSESKLWICHHTWTYYIVERADGRRTKLHYESSLCHADITVRDLIGHSV